MRKALIIVISSVLLLTGCGFVGSGKNYDDEPTRPQRPIDKILETSKPDSIHGYNDDPFSDPGSDYEPPS
jgi:hypothetical protein